MKLKRRQFLTLSGGGLLGSLLGMVPIACARNQSSLAQTQTQPEPEAVPAIAPPRTSMRIAVISDLNEAYGSTSYGEAVRQAIAQLPAWQPDLVLCSGDMVAGQDRSLSVAEVQAMWAGFDRDIAAPLRRANLPYGFTLGNHDASRARFGNDFVYQQERNIAAAYWNDPAHNPGLDFVDRYKFPFYYTFQQNQAFFLVWDASSGLRMPAEDLAWVEQSLGSSLAQQAPMRMAIGHLPLYAVAIGRDRVGEVLDAAADLQALLERYRVHTYISGHHHAYFPGHLGNLDMLHTGALGSGSRRLLAGELDPYKSVTLVDVDFVTGQTAYTTYELPSLVQVNQMALPRVVPSHNGLVIRRDLAWEDLTTAERNACLQKMAATLCHT